MLCVGVGRYGGVWWGLCVGVGVIGDEGVGWFAMVGENAIVGEIMDGLM